MGNSATDKAAVHPAPHEKIKTIEELGAVARAAQAEGRTVALCHGVFDLVHLGHVRHILAARNEADVVIVTVTADRFVNKGPGRPIFPENMRAEMLAALGTVDWVGINQTSSAEPILDTVRPDIYVKGSDYENPEDDVTGKIATEREAVERHGGRIVFTRDVTFSSSSLMNRYFDIYDPPLRDYLQKVREGGGAERLLKLIDKIQDMHVVLVGDTIIDEYQYVTALGKASKENIVATLLKNGEQFAGGVIAAANHVASFCKSVEIVTTLGGNDYLKSSSARMSARMSRSRRSAFRAVRRPANCGTSSWAICTSSSKSTPWTTRRSTRPSGRRSTVSPPSAFAAGMW